ncbi:uncharacterized protein N7458_000524 [Penicillium daleae]|uniref:Piwi domain-containing protein n=1 Tax=Penicillium daleae TaxID=63821 RepID=A0AAD6CGB3_9EURO|nr:uncharacterized protein N7458_000524 [Penicillium daleae]KAJ5464838.1 hypothetical protein N7458_000524 [Penicillium daleae]
MKRPATSSAPCVVGIVASVDAQLAQWPADIRIQPARQEMVSDLDTLLQSRIKIWAKHNKGKFLEHIIVYRDGVSEGQYDMVIEKELPLLKKACQNIYPASDTKKGLPRMAIVVVGKRHNTRFYPTSDVEAERSANPQPGTVVDRGISEARHCRLTPRCKAPPVPPTTSPSGTRSSTHYTLASDPHRRCR